MHIFKEYPFYKTAILENTNSTLRREAFNDSNLVEKNKQTTLIVKYLRDLK